jgi:hypothetical protein
MKRPSRSSITGMSSGSTSGRRPRVFLFADWNMDVYGTMQGPNEFLYTGNLKDWNRVPDLHRITVPTLNPLRPS